MSGRRAVFLVARREVRERLRSRAYLASIGVMLVIVVAIVVVSALTGGGRTTYDVAVAGARAEAVATTARAQAAPFDAEVHLHREATAAAAEAAVRDGDVDAAIVDGRLLVQDAEGNVVGLLQGAARDVAGAALLEREGVPRATITRALDPPGLSVREVRGDRESGASGIAFVGVLLLYVAILTFGYALAAGVVEEKSSRVVEVVVSAIRPTQLLAGKVVGIGLVGALQVLVIVGAGVIAALAFGSLDLPSTTAGTALLVLLYFVLGYAFYACAFAVAGSIVSRQEDVQSVSSPLLLVIIAGYLASLSVLDDGGSTFATVCALLPPVAPMTVPAIAAQGELSAGLLLASVALMLVSTVLLVRLAARIYAGSVLRFGAPLKVREVLRLTR